MPLEEGKPGPIGPGYTILGYTVGDWCRSNDGTGTPEAVGLCLEVKGLPPLVMRLKSRRAVDEMIFALQKHRDSVFPVLGKFGQN